MEVKSTLEHTMKDFQQIIGYQFKKEHLLREALTHSSYTNEGRKRHKNNERLEFLGDSVLSVIVANYLFLQFPDLPEGELTKTRAALVCSRSLAKFAQSIHLGDYLLMGCGEENSGGRERISNLEDAFEALVGAIYLDSGLEQARTFVLKFIPENLDPSKIRVTSDFKTTLQEIIQKNPEEKLTYVLVSESGPDHDKSFEVEVHLNSNIIGTGIGKSKKQAEQAAAQQALELMGYETC